MNIYHKGFDVYSGNNVDFSAKKKEGYEFVIIRAGYGELASQKDKKLEENIEKAKENDFLICFYWFSYARDSKNAKEEAKVFNDIIKKYKSSTTSYVFIDFEYDSENFNKKTYGITYDKSLRTEIIRTFCEEMNEYGWICGYYTNLDYIRNKLNYEQLSKYPLWLAHYTENGKVTDTEEKYNAKFMQHGVTDLDYDYSFIPLRSESINVGDEVNVNGRLYGSSYAEYPGKMYKGKAIILNYIKGRKAPYLIRYGWVTIDSVNK